MFKKLLILLVLISAVACTKPSDLAMLYNPVTGIETGAWQMALLVEMNTNFSSLLYDKTDARFDDFVVRPFQVLPEGSAFYIMPAIYTDRNNAKTYDSAYTKIMTSYIKFNNYGTVVNSPEEADYIIVMNVNESPQFFHGKNTSAIAITILDPDETPVFFAKTDVYSKSDSNFYYQPSKAAKPVKYLTLKGFERLFHEALPQAFS